MCLHVHLSIQREKGRTFLYRAFAELRLCWKHIFIIRKICPYNFLKCIVRCFFCRIAGRSFKEVPSSITRDCRIARRTTTPRGDPCVQDATNLSLVSTRFPADGKPHHVIWLFAFGFRSLHNGHVPQIPSRALCVRVLSEATEQGYLQGTKRQTILPWLLWQALRINMRRMRACNMRTESGRVVVSLSQFFFFLLVLMKYVHGNTHLLWLSLIEARDKTRLLSHCCIMAF